MDKEIVIFTGATAGAEGFKLLDKAPGTTLSTEVVKRNLQNFVEGLGDILPGLNPGGRSYSLDEFTVAVGIDGKGTVGFLGTGAEVGASATLTLTFKRAPAGGGATANP